MKKGLTRFADMTSEEFTVNAATYKTPLLTVEGKKERKLELDADVKRGERRAESQKERYLMRHANDPLMSLKLATDAACLLYTSPSPRDMRRSRMPSSA